MRGLQGSVLYCLKRRASSHRSMTNRLGPENREYMDQYDFTTAARLRLFKRRRFGLVSWVPGLVAARGMKGQVQT